MWRLNSERIHQHSLENNCLYRAGPFKAFPQLQLTNQTFEYLYLPGILFLLKEIGRT